MMRVFTVLAVAGVFAFAHSAQAQGFLDSVNNAMDSARSTMESMDKTMENATDTAKNVEETMPASPPADAPPQARENTRSRAAQERGMIARDNDSEDRALEARKRRAARIQSANPDSAVRAQGAEPTTRRRR